MSEMSEKARAASRSKAERLVRADPNQRVDASGYKPDGAMDADVITGERPVSRRQYRRGGKVAGEKTMVRADRKPRASGGALTAASLINRDVKEANKDRGGVTHDGGMKRGGRAHKDMGGIALPNWADKVSRANGGRTGKMAGGALTPQQRMGLQQPARPMMRKAGGKVADHATGCSCAKCGGGRVGKAAGGPLEGDAPALVPAQSGRLPRYSKEAVDKAIASSNRSGRRISAREAEKIHALLKGPTGFKRGGPAVNNGTRPTGGRLARKSGGRTKKGTNVNIIITQPPAQSPMPAPMVRPPGAPIGMAQGAPPPMMPPPGAPPMMPPPGAAMPPPMGRKAGGRTLEKGGGKVRKAETYPISAGAGGGRGRLEKAGRAARA